MRKGTHPLIKKLNRLRAVKFAAAASIIVAGGVYLAVSIKRFQDKRNEVRVELTGYWESGDYLKAFEASGALLQEAPLDYFFLTIRAYAAYQLAFSRLTQSETARYIDECVFALRKAALTPEGRRDGRAFYVLGKAYYFRGEAYADLCITYLEKALEASFEADDIAEYLGLSYARMKDYRASVEAFARSLNAAGEHPPDALLLAIARSYVELGEDGTAESYLVRCIETTKDSEAKVDARLLLGSVLRDRGEYRKARAQYQAILGEAGERAVVHHELGELYLAEKDVVLARSEWRKANRLDPAFAPSVERINEYR